MSNLIERLRKHGDLAITYTLTDSRAMAREAADEIERLHGRVKELESCMGTPRVEDLVEIERLRAQLGEAQEEDNDD